MEKIIRTTALILIACVAAGLVPAQQPVNCSGPLTEAQLTDLVKNQVPEKRLRIIVQTCGIRFALTDSVKGRLRAAGASAELLEEIRARAPSKADAEQVRQQPIEQGTAREPGLYATIRTSTGDIVVQLFEKQSPLAVNNFVGLAKGTKTWTDPRTGKPTQTPLYNGTTFHRVIPNVMIQGGDPLGNGMGTPGYQFPNEYSPDLTFDRKGRLAMANAGPNTNGSQFFITVAPYPSLDRGYTIFGQVLEGQDVADRISQVPRDGQDKPLSPVTIRRIVIVRVGASAR